MPGSCSSGKLVTLVPGSAAERGQGVVRECIAQARRVRQQVPHRHRRRGGARRVALVRGVEVLDHAFVLERGQVVRDGIVETDVAFLHEHHYRDRRHGFGHRCNAENRVVGHRHAARDVLAAERAGVDDAIRVDDERHDARDPRVANDARQIGVDLRAARQAVLRCGGVGRERCDAPKQGNAQQRGSSGMGGHGGRAHETTAGLARRWQTLASARRARKSALEHVRRRPLRRSATGGLSVSSVRRR